MLKSSAWYYDKEVLLVFSAYNYFDIDAIRKHIEKDVIEPLKKYDEELTERHVNIDNENSKVKITITPVCNDETKFYEGVYRWDGERLTLIELG
jgi:hypothetical protein